MYNTSVVFPQSGDGKGVHHRMDLIASFLVSLAASFVAYIVCKWLERNGKDN